jgi:hypothetical protein
MLDRADMGVAQRVAQIDEAQRFVPVIPSRFFGFAHIGEKLIPNSIAPAPFIDFEG